MIFFARLDEGPQEVRIGSGELTDSLVFDHLTGYSPRIVDFFREHPCLVFEFKTKSANVELLLGTEPAENVIISWSINPPEVAENTEYFAASLKKRLAAASACRKAGYRIAFHFDPIVFYPGWEGSYQDLVNTVFQELGDDRIAWISLGALRMTSHVKKVIETRFPANHLLDGELFPGYDGKLRYSFKDRLEIYTKMLEWIYRMSSAVPVYLCMEEPHMWKECERVFKIRACKGRDHLVAFHMTP